MSKYNEHFLLDEETAKEYCIRELKFYPENSELLSSEISDGNINYIFRVEEPKTSKSIILKQADIYLRSSGRPLDTLHSKIEASLLQHFAKYVPNLIPELYDYNDIMCVISMEDISEYQNMRFALMEGKTLPTFVDDILDFLISALLPSTDLIADPLAKKTSVKKYTNPELCEITERLVLSEPYIADSKDNQISSGNETFVYDQLYTNQALKTEVAILRNHFMNYPQALIHGDLHTGSIFVNQKGIKILDPEFGFYGPMGYDMGNVIGNLFLALAYWIYQDQNNSTVSWIETSIADLLNGYKKHFCRYCKNADIFHIYKDSDFMTYYLKQAVADSIGYAGTEMIRRTVGSSKVPEWDAMKEDNRRILTERIIIDTAIEFILHREVIQEGQDLLKIYWKNKNKYLYNPKKEDPCIKKN